MEKKFRTWNTREKKMDYDPDYNSLSEKINNSFGWSEEIIEMQYTGLKDKMGKPIYEGDILKADSVDFSVGSDVINGPFTPNSIVEFKYGMFYLYKGALQYYLEKTGYEIIGNIHESPELLDGHTSKDVLERLKGI